MKPLLFLLGWCFFGLGAIGVVVPGLPTAPLMLLALTALIMAYGAHFILRRPSKPPS